MQNETRNREMIQNLSNCIGSEVTLSGWIHRIRKLKKITFIVLRDRSGMVQCVVEPELFDKLSLNLESVITLNGLVVKSNNTLNPYEVEVRSISVLSAVSEELPVQMFFL